ncbi:MAG: acyltransferase family protein [Eubacteriales bacterium]|nr:acyltransferase family protein [Eubacteriales bacterium]
MAKGIGILLVVLGHVPTILKELAKIIYPFHVPLFFFVSGYLQNAVKYRKAGVWSSMDATHY